MTIQQAKEMDMVDYLSRQGHLPSKISGNNYWYYSPFHEERDPSFKINRSINRWYDFSEGRGGNLVDFGIAYHNCSINEFLQKADAFAGNGQPQKQVIHPLLESEDDKRIKIVFVTPICSYVLENYLDSRKIIPAVSNQYCKELAYRIGGKNYYAVGFKNDSGGYELRNPNFKGSSSPKDITFIDNGAKEIAVFEGFFNFLSYRSLYNEQLQATNFLILNSTSFFEKSMALMQRHEQVYLWLDNDRTGEKFTIRALEVDAEKFRDQRQLYQHHNDLNDWLVKKDLVQRVRLKPRQ